MKNWTSMLIALVLTAALCLGAVPGMAQGVLTLPSAVKEIQAEAFKGAKGVSEIVLPEGVETIGERAFAESSIEKINLPRSVERIADDAFEGCDALTIYGETGSYAQTFAKEQGIPFVSEEEAAFEYVVVNGGARVTGYTGGRTNVVVPETLGGYPVTAMERAFDNNDEIMTVVLPSTLKTLGGYTFWGCDNLRRVTFNSDITAIGDFEFFQCRVLEDFMLPESVTSIGMKAFSGCRALTKLPFGGHVQTIGNYAFEECWGFTGVDIPDGVKTIGANAFSNGQFLTNIVIPASVTSIGSNAFSGSLYEMTIYGYAGTAAETYAQSKGIAFVDLGAQVPAEFTYATNEMGTFITGYTGAATTVVVPAMIDGVKMDGVWHNAFKGNTLITSVTLQEGLAMIGGEAFRGCTALERVNLPESLTAISAGAFRECSALQTIALPDNAQLGWGVFYGCSSLESVTLPANLTEIPSNAFRECSLLISAQIPAGVTKIDEYAFYACHNLRGVEIPAGVTEIGAYAFDNCEMIEEIVLPEALETLGSYAFYSAGSLQRVEFNSDITEIGEFTFFQCVNLKDIQLPASVTNIGASAFVGCNGLTALPFGEGVVTIGERAFADCYYLAEIEIPETVTSIGARAFSFCYDLKKATIPATVTEIGEMAFWNNDESFTIHGYTGSAAETFAKNNDIPFVAIGAVTPGEPDDPEIEETPATSFSYMIDDGKATILQFIGSETDVVIPAKIEDCPVTSVNSGAFYGAAVESVVFPESVWEIGEYCFSLCERLESVTITAATETIGANIFNECPDVTVYGAENSYAHLYTQRWGVPFVATSHLPARTSSYYLTTDGDEATILFYTGSVADLVIPDNIDGYTITGVGNYAFTDVDGLTKITLPSTLKVIGKHAFSYTGLKEIEIPDGVFNIGPSAFRECYSLTKATIPASVTNITSNAFRDCGDNFTIYGYTGSRAESFAGEQNYLFVALDGEPQDPEGEQTEGDYTYTVENGKATIVAYAGSDADVVIPAALGGYPVEKIGEYAFEAKTMTTVIIPEGVTEIGMGAFYWCESLRAAAIPASIANIGDRAFSNCHTDLIITGTAGTIAQNHAWENAIGFADAATGEILFNNDFAYTVENGVATLTLYTGDDSELVVPAQYDGYTVGALRWGVLQQCDTLTKVTVEARVPEIPRAAFQNCDLLVEVTLPDSVTSIAANAFRWCYALKDVYIPASVTSIDATAFDECPADLTIHGYAGSYAETYANENGIAFAALGGGEPEEPEEPETPAYTYVIDYNFTATITGYTGTETELVLPEELGGYPVGSIGSYAFENRTDLTKITLPSTLGRIGVGAFAGCTGLTEMTIPEGVKEIADSAFWGCTGLQEIEFPGSVTSIGGFAFASCSGLTKATIPANVTSIGERAFYECAASFAIHGYTGSYAQTYAQNNGHPFVALDGGSGEPDVPVVPPAEELEFDYFCDGYTVTIEGYNGSNTNIVIPAAIEGCPVTEISSYAFQFNTALTSVVIPDSVEILGDSCFEGCSALASVSLGSGLKQIGMNAFSGCTALTGLTLPEGLEMIGEAAFISSGLTEITVPKSVYQLGANAFRYNYAMTEATIKGDLGYLSDFAFIGSTALRKVTITGGVSAIGEMAFGSCSALEEITIPASVTQIADNAFSGAAEDFTIYGYYGSYAQTYAVMHGYTFIVLEAGPVTPEEPEEPEEPIESFYTNGYTYILRDGNAMIVGYNGEDTKPVVPDTLGDYPVAAIEERAFKGTAISEITLPESLTHIGPYVFEDCEQLYRVKVLSRTMTFDEAAFHGTSAYLTILCYSDSTALAHAMEMGLSYSLLDGIDGEYTDGEWSWTVENGETTITKYTGTAQEIYLTEMIMGSPIVAIGESAFASNKELVKIVFPDTLRLIGKQAFKSCSKLQEIELPDSVTGLGTEEAFAYCSGLKSVKLSAGLTAISTRAFRGCTSLTSIVIPEGVKQIGTNAFYDCRNLKSVTLPESLRGIYLSAFRYCSSLTEIRIPDGVSMIDSSAFSDCTKLAKVTLPKNLTSIEGNTFKNCTALTSIELPISLTNIGTYAFSGSGLTEIDIPGNVTSIGTYAFSDCTNLTDIAVPNGVAQIMDGFAKGCTALTSIDLLDGVTSIGHYAFNGCTAMWGATIPQTVTSIGEYVFDGTAEDFAIFGYEDSYAQTYALEKGLTFVALGRDETLYTDFDYVIEDGEVCITQYNGSEAEVVVPYVIEGYQVTKIGELAFFGLDHITSVKIPSSVIDIGHQAFSFCGNLTNVEIPAADAEIYEDAFQCSHHALVITGVKDSTACAHALAFGIGFRDAATGEVLFDNDYGYTVIDGEVRINAYTGIEKDVIVPSVIEGYPVFELGAVAMMRNDYMISLTVPSSVRMINGAMAQYCYNLEEIHLSEGLECIYDGAFRGCDSLSRIIIPESVIRIGDRAFHGCSMLASATIPAGVTNIGEDVFAEVAEGFTIYGYSGSAAEAYAAARSIPFVALDAQLPEVETLEAICPWSAGSVSDSVLRAFGAALVNEAGVEQVTYSNLTGAGGVIGHQAIADAQADGKALGMITTELSMYAPMNTASLTYASVDPLCIFSVEAAAVLVNAQWAADNGITDMSSFIAYCTANPASVRMAVSSTGSVWHVAGGYLEKKTGVDLALMNYASGAAASIQNAAMGMDHGVITSLVNAAPFLNSGDLICLGVMGTERDDFYPAYETCTEQGYALVYGAWRGIAAPQGLSASMKAALEASCRTAAQSESFAAAMAEMGCNQTYMGADEAKQFLAQNYADTYEVIVALGL